jgi:hypothetical protein
MQTPQRLDRYDRPLQQFSPALSPIAQPHEDSHFHHQYHNPHRLPGIAEDDILYGSLDISFSRDDVTSLLQHDPTSAAVINHKLASFPGQVEKASADVRNSNESDGRSMSSSTSRNLFPDLDNMPVMSSRTSYAGPTLMKNIPLARLPRESDSLASITMLEDDHDIPNRSDDNTGPRDSQANDLARKQKEEDADAQHLAASTSIFGTDPSPPRAVSPAYHTPYKESASKSDKTKHLLRESYSLLTSAEKRRENRDLVRTIQKKYKNTDHGEPETAIALGLMAEVRRSQSLLDATRNYKSPPASSRKNTPHRSTVQTQEVGVPHNDVVPITPAVTVPLTIPLSHSPIVQSNQSTVLGSSLAASVTSSLPVGGVFCLVMTNDQQPVLVPIHQLAQSSSAPQPTGQPLRLNHTVVLAAQADNDYNDFTSQPIDLHTPHHSSNSIRTDRMILKRSTFRDPLGASQSFLVRPSKHLATQLHQLTPKEPTPNRTHQSSQEEYSHEMPPSGNKPVLSPRKPSLTARFDKYHQPMAGQSKHVHFAGSSSQREPQPSVPDLANSSMYDENSALLKSLSYFHDEQSLRAPDMHVETEREARLVELLTEQRLKSDHEHLRRLQRSLTDPFVNDFTSRHFNPEADNEIEDIRDRFELQQQQRLRQLFVEHYLPTSAPLSTTLFPEDVSVNASVAKLHKPQVVHYPRYSQHHEQSFLKRFPTNSNAVTNDDLDVSALSEDSAAIQMTEEHKNDGTESKDWKQSLNILRQKQAQRKLSNALT